MNIPVWFTKPLTNREARLIRKNGFLPIVYPLIKINSYPTDDIFRQTQNAEKPDALLFTSRNAVNAFLSCRKVEPDWLSAVPVYSVGRKTQQHLSESGISSVIAERQTGSGIAAKLISLFEKNTVIWHFCGNMKRPETGDMIQKGQLQYIPIECYETIELHNATFPEETYRAIVFYSPSAVRAFVYSKKLHAPNVMIIGIGETTANELRRLGFSDANEPEEPSTESVLQLLIEKFNT